MTNFKDLPIKSKLTMMIMLITLFVVLVLSSLLVIQRYTTFKQQMSDEFTTITKIIADRSNAAILFADKQALTETISSLALHKAVKIGCTYDSSGTLLASYHLKKQSLSCPTKPEPSLDGFIDNDFHVSEPILLDEQVEGIVYIRTSTDKLKQEIQTTVNLVLILSVLIIIAALVFARYIQRFISDPLVQLEKIARSVTHEQDYSHRAEKKNDDEIGGLVSAFNTMLETIAAQNQQISEHTNNLEIKVTERTQELAIANRELEAFSYSVSHDLKAPLRIIEGFSRALEEDYGNQLDETARDYLTRVRVGSFKMSQLITNLLQLSRVTRQELLKESFDITKLSHKIVNELCSQEPDRKVNIQIKGSMPVKGDTDLVEILLDNLIGNAWKYSQKKKQTSIEVGFTTHMGNNIYFVRDAGSGFDMKFADQLFKPFNRLHSPEEFEGSGIGLATVSRIIERHHGKIWAESTLGEGSTFFFTLFPTSSNSATNIINSINITKNS